MNSSAILKRMEQWFQLDGLATRKKEPQEFLGKSSTGYIASRVFI